MLEVCEFVIIFVLGREDLKIGRLDLTFTNFIEFIVLHICDMLWGTIIICYNKILNACFRCGNITLVKFNWLLYGK